MDAQLIPHHHSLTTWLLIADGKQAQVYNYIRHLNKVTLGGANPHHLYSEKTGHELIPVIHGDLKADTINNLDIGDNARDTSPESTTAVHNTLEPYGNAGSESKQRFTHTIAVKLMHAHTAKLFNKIILVAPPKMMGELREHLTGTIKNDIIAELSKELTHFKGQELIEHLHETLLHTHVA